MKEEGKAVCGREALFEDPDFPSEDTSLFCDSSTPIARLQGNITWLRPQVRPRALGKSQCIRCVCVCMCVSRLCAVVKIA